MNKQRITTSSETHKSSAEVKVQAVIDAFMRRRCSEQQLVSQLLSLCREHPSATWQALSLLDQLHRRERVSTALFRAVKSELNVIVFSSTGAYETASSQRPNGRPHLRAVVGGMERRHATTVSTEVELELPVELSEPANAMSFQPLRVGALLCDRYVIIEPLTAGSASVTFKAFDRQRESLPEAERYVAIRWLDEHLQNDPYAITALQNEYAQLQAIAHANIPKTYAVHDVQGANSIAMELPAGEFLQCINQRIAGRWPLAPVLALIREIGRAVAHAHANAVVHGNLHPGNVLITNNGEVRVYDFAQADAWANLNGKNTSCQYTVPLAAQRYNSRQRRDTVIARTNDDLYSLAAIAFELLCGHPLEIDALRNSRWRPKYARHLHRRQWHALKRVLVATPEERGSVSEWLADLGADNAQLQLPVLATITAGFPPKNRSFWSRWV